MSDIILLARKLEEVMSLPAGALEASSAFRTLPEWDSLAVLSAIIMLEEQYGVQLGNSDFELVETVEALHLMVQERAR